MLTIAINMMHIEQVGVVVPDMNIIWLLAILAEFLYTSLSSISPGKC
jgi:hypothetical protein